MSKLMNKTVRAMLANLMEKKLKKFLKKQRRKSEKWFIQE